ncbi:UBA/TS-N domain protein [Ceratobasidium sp. AG-Ba]|nr:UBA/TS-N domain protein [Ceratobasidium sp. AG-Ba]
MSDFADLWNSATPSTKKKSTSDSLSNQILASKSNGGLGAAQTTRVGAPSYLSTNTVSPQINTQSSRPVSRTSGGTTPISALNSTTTDAFGDLFSLSDDSRSKNMTIAERKAQADRERAKAEEKKKKERDAQGAFWDQLEFGGPGGSRLGVPDHFSGIPAPTPQPHTTRINTSMLAPSSVSPALSASKVRAVTNADPWDLDSFLAPNQSVSQIATPASNLSPVQKSAPRDTDLFDLLDSSSVQPAQPSSPPGHTPVRSNTPGDFDWGDREDQDDLLGELSKPVSEVSRASARSPAVEHQSSRPAPAGRVSSPPPHILGQIVEMGFSIQQAKRALANTSTGTDVQAALESLLGSQSGANDDGPTADDLERFREEDAAARREHKEAEHRRHHRAGPSRREILQKANEEPTSQIQERADQLLAQASIIGASMFNRANAFWKEGKEKALKAYEERAAAGGSSPQPRQGGRPAWMRDEEPAFSEHSDDRAASHAGFRDEDGDDPVPPRPQAQQPRRTVAQAQSSQPVSTAPVPQRPADKLASLFSDTTTYVSPSRRKPPSQIPTPVQPSPVERRPVSPLPAPRVRTNPPVSASALAAAQVHRTKGTDAFKLGQFGAAVDAYSAAIDLLPEGHISLIPLLNNRAAARAKAGDATGAVEDCTAVLGAIGDDYDPKREAPIPDVDLSAALLKALRRRAEVLESTEKWRRAREDWERLVKVGGTWAGSKAASDGVQGVGRCKRMEDGGNQPPARPSAVAAAAKPKPRPRPKPTSSGLSNTDDSAVRRLKEATAAAEAEGEEKHALKDSVDARVMAWKGGKEANIRALIASLDTILWPELGWTKVGMHELVMPNQVKIKYVRAIAKVHPDKLNTSVTTVEQRMIANSVFGALNEAWNAFAQ